MPAAAGVETPVASPATVLIANGNRAGTLTLQIDGGRFELLPD